MSDDWFDAASRYDQARLEQLLDEGADIDRRDDKGRTALFYAIAPFGGSPDLYKWLLDRGADVNARDGTGESAIDHGWGAVSAALEANMLRFAEDLSYFRGYRIPGNRADGLGDYWGDWWIAHGGGDGDREKTLAISAERIESEVVWLRLDVEEHRLDKDGALTLHGEHACELVHVTLELLAPDRALLTWVDGIAGPATLLLGRVRQPLRSV